MVQVSRKCSSWPTAALIRSSVLGLTALQSMKLGLRLWRSKTGCRRSAKASASPGGTTDSTNSAYAAISSPLTEIIPAQSARSTVAWLRPLR